ncbi:hypothetical protein PR202_gb29897 [Eleusine coracana subsp. coracana]|uniref:Uncharacterized protein n=1 Tax=Eleusine coracana subsp. coracana TaxID=191504 RepID=A0AAV5FY66_ELECO|nr:hypothetical protein PR202_gb29897 [Eleusine coracana subsp. coracana]
MRHTFEEGANMRLTRAALQAAPPPKRSTASCTDSNGAEVSISALQPPAPHPGPCCSQTLLLHLHPATRGGREGVESPGSASERERRRARRRTERRLHACRLPPPHLRARPPADSLRLLPVCDDDRLPPLPAFVA